MEFERSALLQAKCKRIVWESTTRRDVDSLSLKKCLASLRSGDVLVVWRMDRVGKDLDQFLQTQITLARRGIGFESIYEGIETSSRAGHMLSTVFVSLYAFHERTRSSATKPPKRKEETGGRRRPIKAFSHEPKLESVRQMLEVSEHSIEDVARMFDLSKSTVYRIWTNHCDVKRAPSTNRSR